MTVCMMVIIGHVASRGLVENRVSETLSEATLSVATLNVATPSVLSVATAEADDKSIPTNTFFWIYDVNSFQYSSYNIYFHNAS